jgi:hypothetical protein
MEIEGKIKVVGKELTIGTSGFKKRELVVTTDEQYPQHIAINFVQDKVDLIDPYKVGESVKVSINLRGREWVSPQGETKYFNDIQGWRIARQDNSKQTPAPAPAPSTAPSVDDDEEDDLPF